jgi:hypothetical protein
MAERSACPRRGSYVHFEAGCAAQNAAALSGGERPLAILPVGQRRCGMGRAEG